MNSDRKYHHGKLRATLLEAAEEIIREHGEEAVTLRECARRAGVSHSAPLNHFPDRHALLYAIVENKWAEFADALEAAKVGSDDPREALVKVGHAYIRFGRANRNVFGLMMRCDLAEDPAGGKPEGAGRSYGVLRESLAACTSKVESLELFCDFAWSLVQGFIEISSLRPGAESDHDHVDALLRLLFVGIEG